MSFKINQIVKGQVAGFFVILGFRDIDGVTYAQLKRYDPTTGSVARGELALPLTSLQGV